MPTSPDPVSAAATAALVPARPRRGPLTPLELADAAVLGGIGMALVLAGWFLPHASLVATMGAVPFGVVAHRHRFRALMAAAVAGAGVGFLVAGTGPLSGLGTCALVGAIVGGAKRRNWGLGRAVIATLLVSPLLVGATLGLLAVFSQTRRLTLDQLRNSWRGLAGAISHLPGCASFANDSKDWVDTAIRDWWVTVTVLLVLGLLVSVFLAWQILGPVLDRLQWLPATDRLAAVSAESIRAAGALPGGAVVAPLPLRLEDVHVRYPGADRDAIDGVSFALDRLEMVALVGPNGSGKSTLARVIAGVPPTSGQVERAGSPGLGRAGGTALVQQRPESQVLGVRVADDVVWGLPADHGVDVDALLDAVGLSGMGRRDATTLSGGELQRLAVAAALARRPRLLISDESTAMVDADGRRVLTELLAGLPERGTAVVHVTHHDDEAHAAARVIAMERGRLADAAGRLADAAGPLAEPAGSRAADLVPPDSVPAADAHSESKASNFHRLRLGGKRWSGGHLVLRHVSHTYGEGTPWAQPALRGINLEVQPGHGVLIVGRNGSGKSTLAWAMAGLLRPSDGDCLLDGQAVADQVGRVGLAFQHARLQVQRRTVMEDVVAAAHPAHSTADEEPDPESLRRMAAAALETVGLDPEEVGDRQGDELSGGQLRRVALAGLLAARPRVLILDEPMAGQDEPSRNSLLSVLAGLRAKGLTLVVISHDISGMGALCDRTVTLAGGRITSDREGVAG